jgi:hypothetical protein
MFCVHVRSHIYHNHPGKQEKSKQFLKNIYKITMAWKRMLRNPWRQKEGEEMRPDTPNLQVHNKRHMVGIPGRG